MTKVVSKKGRPHRSPATLAVIGGLLLSTIAALSALGIWQVERLFWKRDLIAMVDARVHAVPVPPPHPSDWPMLNATADVYRRITAHGSYANDKETPVTASTELGPGFWVLTPLKLANGTSVMINRGFVPTDRRDPRTRPESFEKEPVTVIGLMRMSEPEGTLLQSNDPSADRWYSRDITAIAAKRGIDTIAPYFIDAEAGPTGKLPVGGLTKIVFPDNHLVYAITWFALALMLTAGTAIAVRYEVGSRRA